MSDNVSGSGGIGFFGLLQIVFIALKVTNAIDWSWWAVFIPTFAGLGLWIIAILIVIIVLAHEA